MTGWLPKEILDHLEHAGYVAVPKERILELHAETLSASAQMLMAYHPDGTYGILKAIKNDLVRLIALEALKTGCMDLEQVLLEEGDTLRYRASLTVLKSRTIT